MFDFLREKQSNGKKSKTPLIILLAGVMLALVIALPVIYLQATDFTKCEIALADDTYAFTGDAIRPKLEVTKNDKVLEEGEDYTVVYKNNEDVGKATIKLTGAGIYRGELSTNFEIVKAKQVIKGKGAFKKNVALDYFDLKQKAKTKLTYKSSDETIAKVNDEGRITPIKPGKVTITVKASGTDSYAPAEKKIKVKITETNNQKRIRGTLEWAKKIADDDSFYYAGGDCHFCHNTGKHYDCIGFAMACYWHGGGIESIHDRCTHHNGISGAREYLKVSSDWKYLGKIDSSQLQPADLMFFYNKNKSPRNHGWYHVEIYYGDGMTVGAHNRSTGIGIIPLSHHLNYAEVYRYVGN